MTTLYSQRDPRWRTQPLGTSTYTIGNAGCLITSVASGLTDWKIQFTPETINQWLIKRRAYVNQCLFNFRSIESLGVRLTQWVDCYYKPAPINTLRSALNAGNLCIAMVDSKPGSDVQSHWVRVLNLTDTDCAIMDPWQLPGKEETTLLRWYGATGWNVARAIFIIAIYEHVIRRSFKPNRANYVQGTLSLRE